jgi:hypothetical protein
MKKVWFFAALLIGGLSSLCLGYSGGDGTSGNPYQIASKADLLALITDYTNYNKCFILTANIDLEGEIFETALFAIGCICPLPMFSGTFDGNGHVIFNLTINRTTSGYGDKYLGLFGVVSSSGQIKNLGLKDVEIKGNFSGLSSVGGLVGYNYGTITHCYTEGIISYVYYSSDKIGGLVGENRGSITSCYAAGSISGTNFVGGLVGRQTLGTIASSYATGTIFGNSSVGGLAGDNMGGSVTNCYATGVVTGGGRGIGGLMGSNQNGAVSNCYATGAVNGGSDIGGLVGFNNTITSTISNCYATGKVSCSFISSGGLVGSNSGSVSACFWDKDTTEQTTSAGGTGKTTSEMKTLSTFTNASWDFTNVWSICEGTSYPRLIWQISETDWVCPDGVNVEDLEVLSACWLEIVQARSDINADDTVNLADFMALAQQWLITGCGLCGGADITGDGNVDESDLALMTEQWLLLENTGCRMADLNADGKIDLADWAIFAQHWLSLND